MCSLYPQNTLPAVPQGAPVASSIALGPSGIYTLSVRETKSTKYYKRETRKHGTKADSEIAPATGAAHEPLQRAPLWSCTKTGQCRSVCHCSKLFQTKKAHCPSIKQHLADGQREKLSYLFSIHSQPEMRQKRHPSPSWQRQWRLACDLAPYEELASETILKPLKNSNEPKMAETGPLQLTQWYVCVYIYIYIYTYTCNISM